MTLTQTILFHALTGLAGYVYVVALEWLVHKYIFHELGKRPGSRFRFHYADHHKATRRHEGSDPAFEGKPTRWDAHGREFWGIVFGMVLHSPLLIVAPAFFIVATLSGLNYHRVHRKSHLDPEWCKQNLPWHWDHHMGDREASNANWCVTCEWFDRLMGTRVLATAELREAEAKQRDARRFFSSRDPGSV